MAPMTAPLLVGCLLLALAGVPKITRPANTVGALRSVDLRVPQAVVRLGGAGEAALGIATALTGSRLLAALVAISYGAFTVFVLAALRRGGSVSSCGCVGRDDTPPTRTHIVVTAGLAVAAAAAAITSADGLLTIGVSVQSLTAIAFAVLSTWLAWLALALLPRVTTVRRRAQGA